MDLSFQKEDKISSNRLDDKLDSVFERLGGFGRYQLFLSITFVLMRNSVSLFFNSVSYLTKVPEEYYCTYAGSEQSFSCKPEDFCQDPTVTSYEPNMELADSYDNWILKYDLTCGSKLSIGIIDSSKYIGWVFTLIFIPKMADALGRYKIMFVCNLITWTAFSMILLTQSYAILIVGMFTMGAASTSRIQVALLYVYESMTRANYQQVYTCAAALEAVMNIMSALYFKHVSKDWFWIAFTGLCAQTIGAFAFWFFTESPRFLVKSGQIDQAQQVVD